MVHLCGYKMDITTTNHVLFGIQNITSRYLDFDYIFHKISAPPTGRWTGINIWMETYQNYEPWGVLIERNDEVVAAVILTRHRRFGIWHIGKPGGNFDPVYFGALDDDADKQLAKAIVDAVNEFGGPWILEVPDLPHVDPVVTQLMIYWPCSQSMLTTPMPCLLFKPGAPLNNYLSKNTRAAVAKARNRIKREGIQMREEWIRDPERIIGLLPQIQNIYLSRDHQLYKNSIIDDAKAKRFFEVFIAEHARLDLIELLVLYLENELAAFAVCLVDNTELMVLVNRASPEWLHYSPGTIVNAEVVRHAYECPHYSGINWGGEPQRYKLSGEVTLIPRRTLYAWSSPKLRLLLLISRYLMAFTQRGISFIKQFKLISVNP
jgi:CelD/BcsL family acetyltransferase involved in cellulose biosynthesis